MEITQDINVWGLITKVYTGAYQVLFSVHRHSTHCIWRRQACRAWQDDYLHNQQWTISQNRIHCSQRKRASIAWIALHQVIWATANGQYSHQYPNSPKIGSSVERRILWPWQAPGRTPYSPWLRHSAGHSSSQTSAYHIPSVAQAPVTRTGT